MTESFSVGSIDVEQVRGVLLEAAEGVAAPVRAGEGEALRLLAADAAHGRAGRPPPCARSRTSTLTGVPQASR